MPLGSKCTRMTRLKRDDATRLSCRRFGAAGVLRHAQVHLGRLVLGIALAARLPRSHRLLTLPVINITTPSATRAGT